MKHQSRAMFTRTITASMLRLGKQASVAAGVLMCAVSLGVAAPSADSLVDAIRSGDADQVKTLLARRADPNARLPDGSTPLSWAIESQHPAMVRSLLDRGGKPNAIGEDSMPALIIACQHGEAAILDMLIKAGASPTRTYTGGVTPLSLCAANAPTEIVDRLITLGANADAPDDIGQTPLMWAAAAGRIDNIQLLLKRGARLDRQTQRGFTPLFFALKSGKPETATALLDAGADADYIAPDGTSVVQLAMYQKSYDFAALMIERGANLTAFDRNGEQLLHAATLANQPALVRLLLTKGANPNALTGTPQVKKRFEVNFTSAVYDMPPKPPLLLAAEQGFATVMQLLADAGSDAKYHSRDGTNIVLAAAASGSLPALQLALRLEPDPNVTTTSGQTPLHQLLGSTATADTAAMIRLLADHGARLDIKNRTGSTPIDLAKQAQTEMRAAWDAAFANRTLSQL